MKEVKRAIKTLKAEKAPGPDDLPSDILLNAGISLNAALTDIFEMIRQKRRVPKQWNNVKIKTLFKNKGSEKMIGNYRGIFLTSVVSKPNRRIADICLLRGCIDHHKYYKKCLYLTSYDVKQCFDKL